MKVETTRLRLREWRTEDAVRIAEIHNHPDVAAFIGGPFTAEQMARRVEDYRVHWQVYGYGRFAVQEKASGHLVGKVGLMHQPRWRAGPDQDEIGWTIDRALWGRGLATEAALAALGDAIDRVGLTRMISYTLPHNVASRRVMEKCGFAYQGRVLWGAIEHVWYRLAAPRMEGRLRGRPPNGRPMSSNDATRLPPVGSACGPDTRKRRSWRDGSPLGSGLGTERLHAIDRPLPTKQTIAPDNQNRTRTALTTPGQ